jgi:hypothetical protein
VDAGPPARVLVIGDGERGGGERGGEETDFVSEDGGRRGEEQTS